MNHHDIITGLTERLLEIQHFGIPVVCYWDSEKIDIKLFLPEMHCYIVYLDHRYNIVKCSAVTKNLDTIISNLSHQENRKVEVLIK